MPHYSFSPFPSVFILNHFRKLHLKDYFSCNQVEITVSSMGTKTQLQEDPSILKSPRNSFKWTHVCHLLKLRNKQEKRAKVKIYILLRVSHPSRGFSLIVGFDFKWMPVQQEINSSTKNKVMWNFWKLPYGRIHIWVVIMEKEFLLLNLKIIKYTF